MAKKDTPSGLSTVPEFELIDEPANRQFVARINGCRVSVEYDRDGERIFLTGLTIPKSVECPDLSDVLVEKVLTHVAEQRWKVIPTHPAIKDYMRTHSAWQRLLLKGIEIR